MNSKRKLGNCNNTTQFCYVCLCVQKLTKERSKEKPIQQPQSKEGRKESKQIN